MLAAAAHPRAKRERNREKAWSMLQENTKKGKKTKALAARAFDRKSGTPGWIRTSGLPLRRRPLYPTELLRRITDMIPQTAHKIKLNRREKRCIL